MPDFTKGSATSSLRTENVLAIDKARWSQQVDQIAKLLSGQPEIQRSRVILTIQIVNSYYVNSEGAEVIEPIQQPVWTYRFYSGGRWHADWQLSFLLGSSGCMPDKAAIENDIKKMISELSGSRKKRRWPINTAGRCYLSDRQPRELFSQGFAGLPNRPKAARFR